MARVGVVGISQASQRLLFHHSQPHSFSLEIALPSLRGTSKTSRADAKLSKHSEIPRRVKICSSQESLRKCVKHVNLLRDAHKDQVEASHHETALPLPPNPFWAKGVVFRNRIRRIIVFPPWDWAGWAFETPKTLNRKPSQRLCAVLPVL